METCDACRAVEGTDAFDNFHDSVNCWADYKVNGRID